MTECEILANLSFIDEGKQLIIQLPNANKHKLQAYSVGRFIARP